MALMNREELLSAIENTIEEINLTKKEIDHSNDASIIEFLRRKLNGLLHRHNCQIDQLG